MISPDFNLHTCLVTNKLKDSTSALRQKLQCRRYYLKVVFLRKCILFNNYTYAHSADYLVLHNIFMKKAHDLQNNSVAQCMIQVIELNTF